MKIFLKILFLSLLSLISAKASDIMVDFIPQLECSEITIPTDSSGILPAMVMSGCNIPPKASDFNVTINEDTNKTFEANDFNFTDLDANSSLDSIYITILPSAGSLKLDGVNVTLNQQITSANIANLVFIPVANENGSPYTTFGFKVNDGESNSTASYTATIHINPVDDAPTLQAIGNVAKTEDSSDFNISLSSFDIDGNPITYTASSSDSSKVTLSIVNGKLVVTPIANRFGTVTVEVNATANGLSATQEFNLSIEPVNDAPTFDTNLTSKTILEDSGSINYELNVSDIDGDDLNVTVTSSNPNIVTVHPNWSGLVNQANYQSLDFNILTVENAFGNATITITVEDTSGEITTQSFNINVTAINDAPELSPISDIFVYKNSGDKNITISATDIDTYDLTYSAIASNTNLITDIHFTDSTMTISLSDNLTGTSDVNVTVSDGEYNISKKFTFKVLALMENQTVKNNGMVYTDEYETVTVRFEEDNITVIAPTQATDGSISHEIDLGDITIKATSELIGSVVAITDNGVHTTYDDENLSLEVNGTILGKATHTLTKGGKTTKATSDFVGAQTVVKRDGNNKVEIETSVQIDTNTSILVTAKEDGTAEHTVTTNGKTSTATSKIVGASTLITTDGNVTTSAGDVNVTENSETYTIKAKVVTDVYGKSKTSFVKVNNSDLTETSLGNTVTPSTPFEAGNNVEIEKIGETLYLKIEAPLSNTNLIIE